MKNFRKIFPVFVLLISILALPSLVAKAATLSVDINDAGCNDVTGGPYCTIQAAIADASPGDTITVAAGTYIEIGQIIIDKDLTIQGAGRDTVIIKPNYDTAVGAYSTTSGWFYVTAGTTFTISGITLDGAGRTINTALQSRGNSIISDCKIQNIMSHQYLGFGIQFLDGANNSVTNCELSNIQRVGIHVRGAKLPGATPNATLTNITYTGKGAGTWLDYGIEFGGGGTGSVVNATISGNLGVASDGSESGGILATDYFGPGTAADIQNSTITGNINGILIGYLATDATIVTASNNNISGNTSYGIYSVGSVMADAENNWWGDSSGPYDPTGTTEVDSTNCTATPATEINADGTGNAVSDNVDYCPWLAQAPAPPYVVTNGVNSNQDTGDSVLAEGEVTAVDITQLFITFSEDMDNSTSGDQVTNAANYRLISEGAVPGISTVSCPATDPGDMEETITSVGYDSTSYTATLNLASPLPEGLYRLFACGTATLRDLTGLPLNGGEDFVLNFEVRQPASTTGSSSGLPATGFPRGAATSLPVQPDEISYQSTELVLQIPAMDQEMRIVGVPNTGSGWEVSWLGNDAGYLHGSAFPTWPGNTVLSAHVWSANNQPGPFAELKEMSFGDRFNIQSNGLTYTYEVRENRILWPSQVNKVFEHEEYDWVTLLTCEFFNPLSGDYLLRRMVRGVLVSID